MVKSSKLYREPPYKSCKSRIPKNFTKNPSNSLNWGNKLFRHFQTFTDLPKFGKKIPQNVLDRENNLEKQNKLSAILIFLKNSA